MANKRQLFLDQIKGERRFRFRVRFENPPGGGSWAQEKSFFAWLDERLGKGKYSFHEDNWEGHGVDCRALHFNDHAIIPDLLTRYAQIYLAAPKKFLFVTSLTHEQARDAREAIAHLQQYLVDQINKPVVIATWAMGTLSFLPGPKQSVGEHMKADRVLRLSLICRQLNVVPAVGETVPIVLEDSERGALEVGFALWRDKKPDPKHAAVLERLIASLTQIESSEGEHGKAQSGETGH